MILRPAIALLAACLAASWTARPAVPAVPVPPQPLLPSGTISHLRIELGPDAIARLRSQPRTWVPARLAEDGFPAEDVRLHLKGRVGSFQPIDAERPALTLDLNPDTPHPRLHGLSRIHLNNALEDPTLLQQFVASAVFRAAGIPAPRVAHARVELNGHPLGLYVLAEGFTSEFLRDQGLDPDGLLGEAESGGDLDSPITVKSPPAHRGERFPVEDLLAATRPTDLSLRDAQLDAVLDTERFLTFLALEVLLGHRDGYGLARNNYRLYRDPASGRCLFLPHGLDQLFGNPALPWKPAFAGQVARALLETPEGQRRYEERFRILHRTWLATNAIAPLVEQSFAALRPSLSRHERETLSASVADLQVRIGERARNLAEQLARPTPPPLAWSGNTLALTNWTSSRPEPPASANSAFAPTTLHLAAISPTSDSWRCRIRLDPGRYRFLARSRVAGVVPLPFGRAQGAGLRVAGQPRTTSRLTGTADWTPLALDFEVPPDAAETTLICELRARTGQAWFDLSSLQLVRLPESTGPIGPMGPMSPLHPTNPGGPIASAPSLARTASPPIP